VEKVKKKKHPTVQNLQIRMWKTTINLQILHKLLLWKVLLAFQMELDFQPLPSFGKMGR